MADRKFLSLDEKTVFEAADQFPVQPRGDSTQRVQRMTGATILAATGRGGSGSGLPANPSENDVVRYDGTEAVWGKIGSGAIAPRGLAVSTIFGDNVIEARALADAVEAALVPAGGTSRQVLAKSSSVDHATEWIDLPAPQGGGGGLNQAAVDSRIIAGTKPFARDGNTTKPLPLDLAADPTAGEVLKVSAGGATEWGDGGLDQNCRRCPRNRRSQGLRRSRIVLEARATRSRYGAGGVCGACR